MPKHRLSMPPSEWPEDIRKRFDRHPLTPAQRTRLGQGLGRWFRIAADLGTDPAEVTREGWRDRTRDLRPEMRNAVRQALSIVYPGSAAALYESDAGRRPRTDARAQLQHTIRRALARFPAAWRQAAAPLLHVDPDGVGDGILVQAWAPSTIKRRLEAGAAFFAFCGGTDLPVDITPVGVRAKLRRDQARVAAGERRIGGVSVDLVALYGLASAVHPDRTWRWLAVARDRIGKLAAARGSRNAGRAVDAAELRAAGQQLLDRADADHAAARNRRDFVKAHTRARTAVTMILLSEAPIRIAGCAELELEVGLLSSLGGLFLDAGSTKGGNSDRRAFSSVLVDALTRYIGLHRKVVAAPGETRLFVGERGAPVKSAQLTACLGRITKTIFGKRVTAHAIRHSVANFIVATAPSEAALASVILNHRTDSVTPIYQQRANQVVASRRLGEATEQSAATLAARTSPTRKQTRPRRPTRPTRKVPGHHGYGRPAP